MSFQIPTRASKPRDRGFTNMLDSGVGLDVLRDQLAVAADFVDYAKIGWATALVLPDLAERIKVYRAHDVDVCCGGTMFEYAYLTGQVDEYREWMKQQGIGVVEVSDGTIDIPNADKLAHIRMLASDFMVFSEVGSKDTNTIVSPAKWVSAIRAELEAGASHVILEGRESGTSGLYRGSGEMRTGLVDEILDAGIPSEQLIFEAPQKAHQVYLLDLLGPDANFANIPLGDLVPLETLRLGLRADTLVRFNGRNS